MKGIHYWKNAILLALVIMGFSGGQIFAQGKKKPATKAQATPITQEPTKYDSTIYRYFLFPQFYSYWPVDNNDTILRYECYDVSKNYMNVDTVYNISDVQHIYFVKTYTDYTQTTIDPEGKPHPGLIVKKLYSYDRMSNDSWSAYDHLHHYTSSLKEYKEDIVRMDTTIVTDPITETRQITVRKYYKVLEADHADSATTMAPATPGQADNTPSKVETTVYSYLVPEFYYYVPKKSRDTTFEFRCYDYRDSLVPDVTNYDSIRYFSLFKSFIDSNHTYKDADGAKKPLPISTIIKRYDRLSQDRWMSIEYPGNKYMELTEYKNIVVSSDTVTLIDPITDKTVLKVFNHYKVVK